MHEAMVYSLWKAFVEWIFFHGHSVELTEIRNMLGNLCSAVCTKPHTKVKLSNMIAVDTLEHTEHFWKEFTQTLEMTGWYWLIYINMVNILPRYMLSERVGDWYSHLEEVKRTLSFTVMSRHHNYVPCLPIQPEDMYAVSPFHPDIYQEFLQSRFTVHQTAGSSMVYGQTGP